jgi:hypothetical protein
MSDKAAISAAKAHQAIMDMADAFREAERERIIQLLQVMRNDLASCIKDDDCLVRADVIDVCISDIKGENE